MLKSPCSSLFHAVAELIGKPWAQNFNVQSLVPYTTLQRSALSGAPVGALNYEKGATWDANALNSILIWGPRNFGKTIALILRVAS